MYTNTHLLEEAPGELDVSSNGVKGLGHGKKVKLKRRHFCAKKVDGIGVGLVKCVQS